MPESPPTAAHSTDRTSAGAALPAHDYISPGLALVIPDAAFPHMIVGDSAVPQWPWLRRWVGQNWYTDGRYPLVGFATRDEAAILHNNALLFHDRDCLEVGCWRGWSAVHIALGAGHLDIIDPIFDDPAVAEDVHHACRAAGVLDKVTFHNGYSPAAIDRLAASTGKKWSLIFIDGDHEGDAPRRDAMAAMRHAAGTAMILFHDLASPYVAAGLDALRDAGWNTMLYQTMQIMGVAWRGDIQPVQHVPDPSVPWTLPAHLSGYRVSGWERSQAAQTDAWRPGMDAQALLAAAMARGQAAEDALVSALALARARDSETAELRAAYQALEWSVEARVGRERERAEAAEHDAFVQFNDAQAAYRALQETQAKLAAIESSISWRIIARLHRWSARHPRQARLLRGGAKLLWWTVTLRLLQKLRARRAALARLSADGEQSRLVRGVAKLVSDRLDAPGMAGNFGGGLQVTDQRQLNDFLRGEQLAAIIRDAQAIAPEVGEIIDIQDIIFPPFHDIAARAHAEIRRRLPAAHYDSIICVPWIRTGGADLVAGLLAKALLRIRPGERVLVLRTDQPHFERANWLPAAADCVDVSDVFKPLPEPVATHLLRVMFRGLTASRVFNVNSRLCWTALQDYGRNLACTLATYSYMFCWDQTASGLRAGYPAMFFAGTMGSITAFLTDTAYLRDELVAMYRLPAGVARRIIPLFTPAQTALRVPAVAVERLTRAAAPAPKLVLWAGRLDRQKRFDLVLEIARLMPDVEFRCWGAALLDAPPDLSALPGNVRMQGSFDSFDELPLVEAGAWLYTALWEGMPTTIIELATRGVTMVASAVGGVPELIREDTGWPVAADATADGYVACLREALDTPAEAARRAEALQARVASIYNEQVYDAALGALLDAEMAP
jgi:glycosyltransferase involved in cell wall biosynthesis